MNWLIKGGRVVDPAAGVDGIQDVLVSNGAVVQVGPDLVPPPEAGVLDAGGKIVTPGFIDMHTHLREPGFEYKETIATGLRAAVMGGYTAVCCMPNTSPSLDNAGAVTFVLQQAARAGTARLYPIGNITKGGRGGEIAEMGEMAEAGAVAFSDDGRPVSNARVMRLALEYARQFMRPVISHCEDLDLSQDGQMNEGYQACVWGLKGIPAAAEEVMVARDIELAGLTGGRLHLAHLSTRGSIELLQRARQRGLPVSAEVSPHHLTLTEAAVEGYDTNAKVNPPLRTWEDVAALREAAACGLIDAIATDHAPHAAHEKEAEFDAAPFGISGLETAVPLVVTHLVLPGVITWARAVELLSRGPADLLGIPGGTLAVGQPADITIIDPGLKLTVEPERFESMGRNSPFTGQTLSGWPVATLVGGKLVMNQRRIVAV